MTRKNVTPAVFKDDDERPTFACKRVEGGRECDLLTFVCPKCREERTHGAGPLGSSPGAGDGHRSSHCSKGCWPLGYYLEEIR